MTFQYSARDSVRVNLSPEQEQFIADAKARPQLSSEPASQRQEGGTHYKDMAIQPFEYITKNKIGFAEGNVIKYVSRWKNKNGIEDLKKARHFIDLLIESEIAK